MRLRARAALALGILLSSGLATAAPDVTPPTAEEAEPGPAPAGDHTVIVAHRPRSESPIYGPRLAPVTIDFFCELQNHYSMRPIYEALLQLQSRHPRRLRIIFRLVDGRGRTYLSEAALEAFAQGRFDQMMAEIFSWRSKPQPQELEEIARRAGVDYAAILRAREEGRHIPTIERERRYRSRRQGLDRRGPLLLFNGVAPRNPSVRTLDELEQEYDLAYARAREMLLDGVPLDQLYQRALREVDASRPPTPTRVSRVDGAPRGVRPEPIPPRLVGGDIAAHGDFDRGAEQPAVEVVFLCSFQSWNCAMMYKPIEKLRALYPDTVRVGFRPLFDDQDPDQPMARLAHEAALCAADQDAFWAYYEQMYGRLTSRRKPRPLTPADMRTVAKSIGIEPDDFIACIRERRHAGDVAAALAAARRAGITQTPAVIIGGRLHTGTRSLEELRSLVEEELRPGLLERMVPLTDAP